ncbi:MAG: hypothetical protein ACOYLQ_20230 [Hyphomicrobiaceae bacterium]
MGTETVPGRSALQRRAPKVGFIATHGSAALPCVVRERTAAEARIEYAGAAAMPHQFKLVVAADGVEVDCRVAWRHRHTYGLRIVTSTPAAAAGPAISRSRAARRKALFDAAR